MPNYLKKILLGLVFIASVLIVLDVFFPQRVYKAEKIESILITSNDEYYTHFVDWIYEGNVNALPGERVLVIYKKSRIFGETLDRQIHDEFKIKR